MNKLTDAQVIINGKQYTLCGYESEEYLQKVASYLNAKYTEIKKQDSYRHLSLEMKNIFIQLNIADDYFKLKSQLEEAAASNDTKSNEIFELNRQIISIQTKLESAQSEIKRLRKEKFEEEKNNIRLSAELEECRKNIEIKQKNIETKQKNIETKQKD